MNSVKNMIKLYSDMNLHICYQKAWSAIESLSLC